VLDPRFELCRRLMVSPESFEITRLEGQREDLPGLIFAGLLEYKTELPVPKGWHLLAIQNTPGEGLDFGDLRVKLYESGLRSLLVEGGAAVAQSLILQRSLDKLTLVTTPVLIGADGLGFSPELNCESIDQCPRLHKPSLEILGQDCAIHGYLDWPTREDPP
jgi:riboflavin biosynthesis pyrimidine reductase